MYFSLWLVIIPTSIYDLICILIYGYFYQFIINAQIPNREFVQNSSMARSDEFYKKNKNGPLKIEQYKRIGSIVRFTFPRPDPVRFQTRLLFFLTLFRNDKKINFIFL